MTARIGRQYPSRACVPLEAVDTLGDTTPGALDALEMLEMPHPAVTEAEAATRIGVWGWAVLACVFGAALLASDLMPWGWAVLP